MTSELPARLYADLIGRSFAPGGRGPGAYDCWGLLLEVMRRLGHAPTDVLGPQHPVAVAEWEPVPWDDRQPGDGILLRSDLEGYVWHVGVLVSSSMVLHARPGAGVCRERVDAPAFRRRMAGVYHFRSCT